MAWRETQGGACDSWCEGAFSLPPFFTRALYPRRAAKIEARIWCLGEYTDGVGGEPSTLSYYSSGPGSCRTAHRGGSGINPNMMSMLNHTSPVSGHSPGTICEQPGRMWALFRWTSFPRHSPRTARQGPRMLLLMSTTLIG